MLVALIELVFHARGEIVESALRVAAVGAQFLVRCAEADAEVLGDPLRHVDGELRLASDGAVAVAGHFSRRDRRQRELIRDKRILGDECCGKKSLARESMRGGFLGCNAERKRADDGDTQCAPWLARGARW